MKTEHRRRYTRKFKLQALDMAKTIPIDASYWRPCGGKIHILCMDGWQFKERM